MPRLMRYLAAALACLVVVVGAATVLLPVNLPVRGWLFGSEISYSDEEGVQGRITLPPGYTINVYATGIDDARFMQLTASGDILVTSTDDGHLVLVKRDGDGDGRSDGVEVLADGLELPHGIWLDGTKLYIAEEHRVIRYRYEPQSRKLSAQEVVLEGLPAGDGHHTRTIKQGPDGWFYVSIGSSCNICIEEHEWRATIIRFKPDEADPEVFAKGLRNTVGFDWQPVTGLMYGVDNGRDWSGDDFPPDELNQINQGGFYGWPYFNGNNVPDEDHGADPAADALTPVAPAHEFGAHVAPLGITFLKHQAGTPLEGVAMVGQHGSWNRSTKVGYKVVSLHWGVDGEITEKPFAEGFERDDDVIGRPVDIIDAPDGTLYISDDYAGVIYRVIHQP